MVSHKRLYTENELSVLTALYARGFRSKTKNQDLLEEAKTKTGLETGRIMQWIHSRSSRDKAKSLGRTATKLSKKRPTLYSAALSEVLKKEANGKNVTERSKFQGIEWKKIQQNPEEFDKVQQIYERQIEEYENKLRNPTPEERKRRDKWLISKMENLIEELSGNGTEVAVVMVHKKSGSCTTRGTLIGEDFFDERHDIMAAFYQKCIGSAAPLLFKKLSDMRRELTILWNEKYSPATGEQGRIPYASIARREISIILHGTDVLFKEPKLYRRFELEKILENSSGIRLEVLTTTSSERLNGLNKHTNDDDASLRGPLTEIMDTVASEKDTLVNDERSSKASDNIEDGEDMSATNLTAVDAPSETQVSVPLPSTTQDITPTNDEYMRIDGNLIEVVLEDEDTVSQTDKKDDSALQITKGQLLVADWGECGAYLGYVRNAYIEWSSMPIVFNKKRKILGMSKEIRLGRKPVHRTKLDNHGRVLGMIPEMLYKREKCTINPTLGFHEFIDSLLNI